MVTVDPFGGWGLPVERVVLPNGDHLATVIDGAGEWSYWVLRPGRCDCSSCQGDASVDSAPREQDGRLPTHWRSRVRGHGPVFDPDDIAAMVDPDVKPLDINEPPPGATPGATP